MQATDGIQKIAECALWTLDPFECFSNPKAEGHFKLQYHIQELDFFVSIKIWHEKSWTLR